MHLFVEARAVAAKPEQKVAVADGHALAQVHDGSEAADVAVGKQQKDGRLDECRASRHVQDTDAQTSLVHVVEPRDEARLGDKDVQSAESQNPLVPLVPEVFRPFCLLLLYAALLLSN